MIELFDLSERRACRLVGLSRDSYRHEPEASAQTQALSGRIVEIAHQRRRFGYRRVHDLLRPEFPSVNHKRVYRLYRNANLAVRKRKKAKRPMHERVPLQLATRVNQVWSMDFVSDSLSNGRRLKYLTVADDFSHECVDITVDYGISGQYVTRLLDQAALFRGYPQVVRTDNVRAGIHKSSVSGLGAKPWDSTHSDSTRAPHAERLHREFQRQVPRRTSQRTLVSNTAAGPASIGQLAEGLQRDPAT
jgi:transposase InsO family protein